MQRGYQLHLLLLRDHHLLVVRDRGRPVRARVLLVLADNVGGAFHGHVVVRVLADGELLLVDVAEDDVEDHGQDAAGDGDAAKVPGQVGVRDDRRARETDGVGDGRVEEVDGRDHAPHVDGRAGVGDAVRRNVDEELGDTT